MPATQWMPFLVATGCLLTASPLSAAPLAKTPGATVIVPYFEVDLDAPDGRTTLVTVGNAGEPVVAHATLWTDWGYPAYAWDIYLGRNAMVTYNLRDLLVSGTVVPTRAPAGFGGCGDPVANPAPTDLPLLQKQLTGQEFGILDECTSDPRADRTLATGSLTIDTVVDCRTSTAQRYPNDFGYFNGPHPRASSQGGLWGDFTLVDPAENFAQGFEALQLGLTATADEPRFGGWPGNAGIAREALAPDWSCSRVRFLQGGPFAARTSFFVYMPPPQVYESGYCEYYEYGGRGRWSFRVLDEAGQPVGTKQISTSFRRSARLEAGADVGIALNAGYVDLYSYASGDSGGVPEPDQPLQSVILAGIEASGRFAVGVAGSPLGNPSCR